MAKTTRERNFIQIKFSLKHACIILLVFFLVDQSFCKGIQHCSVPWYIQENFPISYCCLMTSLILHLKLCMMIRAWLFWSHKHWRNFVAEKGVGKFEAAQCKNWCIALFFAQCLPNDQEIKSDECTTFIAVMDIWLSHW